MVKRSVRLSGHATSLALEPEFWAALATLADSWGLGIDQAVARIDADRENPAGNLTSAIRVQVLDHFRRLADQVQPPPEGSAGG
ncbi:MAG: ribbon-helix-helix domain-containing protein [Rhodospirillaceae bacterium]|nr:ribbon-helix-helix domain-containing protein [Rhodospirillaceae bacterium]